MVREPDVAPQEAAPPLRKSPLTRHIATIQPSEPTRSVFSALTTPVFESRSPDPAPRPPFDPVSPPEPPIWSRHEPDIADRAYAGTISGGAARVPTYRGPAAPAEIPRPFTDTYRYLRQALRVAAIAVLSLVGLFFVLVVLYRWVDPPMSTLMLGQRLDRHAHHAALGAAGAHVAQPAACRHHVRGRPLLPPPRRRLGRAGGGHRERPRRGAARRQHHLHAGGQEPVPVAVQELSAQGASRFPLAFAIEAVWPKRRILEIYLNIAEWGPGIFGAEAAARYHFRKPAALLSPREAALLAVSCPTPSSGRPAVPVRARIRLADNLLLRMRAAQATQPVRDGPANRGRPCARIVDWPCGRDCRYKPRRTEARWHRHAGVACPLFRIKSDLRWPFRGRKSRA